MEQKKETIPMCIPVLDMVVGQIGYISIYAVAIQPVPNEDKPTEFYRQINLMANVQPTPTMCTTVKITRVGSGIKGEDYQLDFSDCSEVIEFEENDTKPFKMSTLPYQIEPHFVTKIEKYNYMSVEDLESEMGAILNQSDKLHTDTEVQKIIEIIVLKIKKGIRKSPFYDLFGIYDDAYEIISRFEPIKEKNAQSKSDYQIMSCDQEIAQATKDYTERLLKEKFLAEFPSIAKDEKADIVDRITDSNDSLNFLEDILYQIKS
jgi:hypothetical protein